MKKKIGLSSSKLKLKENGENHLQSERFFLSFLSADPLLPLTFNNFSLIPNCDRLYLTTASLKTPVTHNFFPPKTAASLAVTLNTMNYCRKPTFCHHSMLAQTSPPSLRSTTTHSPSPYKSICFFVNTPLWLWQQP